MECSGYRLQWHINKTDWTFSLHLNFFLLILLKIGAFDLFLDVGLTKQNNLPLTENATKNDKSKKKFSGKFL